MASTTFVDRVTPIQASWLNDVNRKVYLENISVKDFGAVGDGVTDDTAAIQAALNSGAKGVYFPSGTYLVKDATNTVNGTVLDVPSDVTLFGDGYGSVLKLGAHTTVGHRMLRLNGVSNVEIRGLRFDGNRTQQTGAGEEQSHAVFMTGTTGCTNVRVLNCHLTNMMGDGVYIGGSANPGSQNVLIEGNTFDNNFRQCVSIVRGQFIRIIGNDLSNTTGTNPAAGVDIEANTAGDTLRQITISGNNIRGNYFGIFCNELAPAREITITGNTFSDQRHADIYCRGHHVVISNNVIYPNGKTVSAPAIEMETTSRVQVIGNVIYGSYAANERGGIRISRGVTNAVIANNLIRTTTNSGILVYTINAIGTGSTNNIAVVGNVLENCLSDSSTSGAILLGAVSGTSDLTNVIVKTNVVSDTRTGGLQAANGIRFVNVTDAMLKTIFVGDNTVSGPTFQTNSATGWEFVSGQLMFRATLDFDLTAVTSQTLTMTATGAALGDVVALGVPNGSAATDVVYMAWVSAADQVSIRALRVAGTPNPASGTFNILVTKIMTH